MRIHFFKALFTLLSFGSGFKIQGSTEKVAAFAAYLYEAMPEGGTFASLSTLAENFSKIKKLFSIVKSFSIFGNLFTILNSLIHRSISHPMIA